MKLDSQASSKELQSTSSSLRARYAEAAESLEQYLKLTPNVNNASQLHEQLEAIRVYAQDGNAPAEERTIFRSTEVGTKALIISKPEPPYTPQARKVCVNGIIRLRAVLSADGTVKHILPIKSLDYGLTELAIKAARQIKFQPAIKDGRLVSQIVIVEYNFICR